jgi:hypothetical protein
LPLRLLLTITPNIATRLEPFRSCGSLYIA